MIQPFNPKEAIKASKARENMIAYVAFTVREETPRTEKEGFVKIASCPKHDSGGFLALTFLVDTEDDTLKNTLHHMFEALNADVFRATMGANLESVGRNVLDEVSDIRGWVVEELNIHLRRLDGYEKTVVEKDLIPTLEKIWPIVFEPVEWLPEDDKDRLAQSISSRYPKKDKGALGNILRKFFGE